MSIWHQLRKNKGAIMGLVLLVVIIVVALGSPYLFDYETQVIANNIKERMQPPSAEHWFGTDDMAGISSPGSATAPAIPWPWASSR